MFNKTWINSHKAWAVQRQKNVDLEKYLPLELNEAFCRFCGELRRVDGELPFVIYLKHLFPWSLKCVHKCISFKTSSFTLWLILLQMVSCKIKLTGNCMLFSGTLG